MLICIRFGGFEHCFYVPVIRWPWWPPQPGPGPVNYPALFHDATILTAVRQLLPDIGDANVRGALERGLQEGLAAMQQHAGEHVSLRFGELRSEAR